MNTSTENIVSIATKYRLILPVIAALLACLQTVSFADSAIDDLQLWLPVTFRADLPRKISTSLEVQPRLGNNILGESPSGENHWTLLMVRPAIGVRLNKKVTLWQGVGWAPTFTPTYRNEFRLYQQVDVSHTIKRLKINHRTRLEERFIADTDGTAVRMRHLVRGLLPIKAGSKWSLAASDEAFANFNSVSNGPQAGFDQNRLFIGINKAFSENVNAEAGYMMQYVNRAAPLRNQMNHAILAGVNIIIK